MQSIDVAQMLFSKKSIDFDSIWGTIENDHSHDIVSEETILAPETVNGIPCFDFVKLSLKNSGEYRDFEITSFCSMGKYLFWGTACGHMGLTDLSNHSNIQFKISNYPLNHLTVNESCSVIAYVTNKTITLCEINFFSPIIFFPFWSYQVLEYIDHLILHPHFSRYTTDSGSASLWTCILVCNSKLLILRKGINIPSLDLFFKASSNIVSVSLSPSTRFIAWGDISNVRVFDLEDYTKIGFMPLPIADAEGSNFNPKLVLKWVHCLSTSSSHTSPNRLLIAQEDFGLVVLEVFQLESVSESGLRTTGVRHLRQILHAPSTSLTGSCLNGKTLSSNRNSRMLDVSVLESLSGRTEQTVNDWSICVLREGLLTPTAPNGSLPLNNEASCDLKKAESTFHIVTLKSSHAVDAYRKTIDKSNNLQIQQNELATMSSLNTIKPTLTSKALKSLEFAAICDCRLILPASNNLSKDIQHKFNSFLLNTVDDYPFVAPTIDKLASSSNIKSLHLIIPASNRELSRGVSFQVIQLLPRSMEQATIAQLEENLQALENRKERKENDESADVILLKAALLLRSRLNGFGFQLREQSGKNDHKDQPFNKKLLVARYVSTLYVLSFIARHALKLLDNNPISSCHASHISIRRLTNIVTLCMPIASAKFMFETLELWISGDSKSDSASSELEIMCQSLLTWHEVLRSFIKFSNGIYVPLFLKSIIKLTPSPSFISLFPPCVFPSSHLIRSSTLRSHSAVSNQPPLCDVSSIHSIPASVIYRAICVLVTVSPQLLESILLSPTIQSLFTASKPPPYMGSIDPCELALDVHRFAFLSSSPSPPFEDWPEWFPTPVSSTVSGNFLLPPVAQPLPTIPAAPSCPTAVSVLRSLVFLFEHAGLPHQALWLVPASRLPSRELVRILYTHQADISLSSLHTSQAVLAAILTQSLPQPHSSLLVAIQNIFPSLTSMFQAFPSYPPPHALDINELSIEALAEKFSLSPVASIPHLRYTPGLDLPFEDEHRADDDNSHVSSSSSSCSYTPDSFYLGSPQTSPLNPLPTDKLELLHVLASKSLLRADSVEHLRLAKSCFESLSHSKEGRQVRANSITALNIPSLKSETALSVSASLMTRDVAVLSQRLVNKALKATPIVLSSSQDPLAVSFIPPFRIPAQSCWSCDKGETRGRSFAVTLDHAANSLRETLEEVRTLPKTLSSMDTKDVVGSGMSTFTNFTAKIMRKTGNEIADVIDVLHNSSSTTNLGQNVPENFLRSDDEINLLDVASKVKSSSQIWDQNSSRCIICREFLFLASDVFYPTDKKTNSKSKYVIIRSTCRHHVHLDCHKRHIESIFGHSVALPFNYEKIPLNQSDHVNIPHIIDDECTECSQTNFRSFIY